MNSKLNILLLGAFLLNTNSYSGGGMISASPVKLVKEIECQAKAIDPTFPTQVDHIAIAHEDVDCNELKKKLGLTVITYNEDGEVLRYHPAFEKSSKNDTRVLEIKRYRDRSLKTIGELRLNGENGVIAPEDFSILEELILLNCKEYANN